MMLFTLRDVEEGEELTISYIEELMPYTTRQERLKTMYLFNCACAACSLDETARAESDRRRAKIMELRRTFDVDAVRKRWSEREALGLDGEAVKREVLEPLVNAWSVGVEEGVEDAQTQAACAETMMRISLEMEHAEGAVLWGKRAALAFIVSGLCKHCVMSLRVETTSGCRYRFGTRIGRLSRRILNGFRSARR